MSIRAKTMIELKKKLRAAMGWKDARSWTAAERLEISTRYKIVPDYVNDVFVANPR